MACVAPTLHVRAVPVAAARPPRLGGGGRWRSRESQSLDSNTLDSTDKVGGGGGGVYSVQCVLLLFIISAGGWASGVGAAAAARTRAYFTSVIKSIYNL